MLVNALVFMVIAAAAYLIRPSRRLLHLFVVSVWWLPLTTVTCWLFLQICRISTERYDLYFYEADRFVFGVEPAFLVGQFLADHPWINSLARLDYDGSVYVTMALVLAMFLLESLRDAYRFLIATLATPVFAIPCYWLLPACGPRYAFADFPNPASSVTPHILNIANRPPNCLPSAHEASAILVLVFLWRWRTGRIVGLLHLVLTSVATLGIGEHYGLDLLCAIPFIIGLLQLSSWIVDWPAWPAWRCIGGDGDVVDGNVPAWEGTEGWLP